MQTTSLRKKKKKNLISKFNVQKIIELDKRCRVYGCGSTNDLEVHHIIPRSSGGPDEEWNLILLCHYHHDLITNGKLSDLDMLKMLINKKDFRWQQALDWHENKHLLKRLRNAKTRNNL